MVAVAGLRGTGDWGTDERPKNFREMILWLNPNGDSPLTALMAKTKKESTDDPEFSWWEEELDIIRLQLDDGDDMLNSDTTFVVDAGALQLAPGDILMIEKDIASDYSTTELIKVTSVTNDTTFVASRGYANTTAAAIVDDTWMTVVGTAFAEGTTSANAVSNNPTKYSNYCQIFKSAYEDTETAKATRARTGNVVTNDKKRGMFRHSVKMEMAALFGVPYEATGSNGKPERSTGGIIHYLSEASRVSKPSAFSTFNDLIDAVYDVFDYTGDGATGGDERIILCGNGAATAMSKLAAAAGTVNFGEVVKVYGMNLTKFVAPQGTFYVKTHPLLNRHSLYKNSMLVLDPPGLVYRPLRDTKSQTNIQANDADTEKGQWLTEAGYEFHHMKTMKFLHGIALA